VNFAMADEYTWGRKAGCDFVKKSCLHYMRNKRGRTPRQGESSSSISPFCDQRTQVKPSGKFSLTRGDCKKEVSTSFCNLIQYKKPLRREHRNLEIGTVANSSLWGAGAWLADFCPTLVTMYSWQCANID